MDVSSAFELVKWAGGKAIGAIPPAAEKVAAIGYSVLFGEVGTNIIRGCSAGVSVIADAAELLARADNTLTKDKDAPPFEEACRYDSNGVPLTERTGGGYYF